MCSAGDTMVFLGVTEFSSRLWSDFAPPVDSAPLLGSFRSWV